MADAGVGTDVTRLEVLSFFSFVTKNTMQKESRNAWKQWDQRVINKWHGAERANIKKFSRFFVYSGADPERENPLTHTMTHTGNGADGNNGGNRANADAAPG